jgi:hypothetical protein
MRRDKDICIHLHENKSLSMEMDTYMVYYMKLDRNIIIDPSLN